MTCLVAEPNTRIAEAERIADDALSRAIITSKGLCWPSIVAAYSKDRIVRQPNVSLANGNSGIALFLIELYLANGNEPRLEAAQKAVEWAEAECAKNLRGAKSLWFGQLGVVEALLAWYRVTAEESALDRAVALALRCAGTYVSDDRSAGPTLCSIGGGAAGALVTLLRVHDQRHDARLLEASKKLIELLIRRARMAPEGIYWDRLGDTIRPPIGFLTGTAGISYALAQANRVIPFEGCSFLVAQATKYENWLVREDTRNWPDFSHTSWTAEDLKNLPKKVKKALKKGDHAFFTATGDSASWAHGAAGIALSRSACEGLLDEEQRQADLDRAKQRLTRELEQLETMPTDSDASLGSGLGGVGLSCLALQRTSGDQSFKSWACSIERRLAKQRKLLGFYRSGLEAIEDGEDLAFLTGSSGVGFLMLGLQNGDGAAGGAFAPTFALRGADCDRSPERLSQDRTEVIVLNSTFPKTVRLLRQDGIEPRIDSDGSEGLDRPLIERIEAWIGMLSLDNSADEVVREVYRIERARFDFDFCEKGDRYLALKREDDCMQARRLLDEVSEKKLLACKLLLVPEVRVLEGSLRCQINECEKAEVEEGPGYYLHHRRHGGVFEVALPKFNYTVLNVFNKKARIRTVLKRVLSEMPNGNSEKREKVKSVALEQIKEAMRQGLLSCV